jgi:hypothetical protein
MAQHVDGSSGRSRAACVTCCQPARIEMERPDRLYIASSGSDILSTESGEPVFPVRDSGDLECIRSHSGGFPLEQPSRVRTRRSVAGSGVVVAVGADMADGANLYGHLTKRGVSAASSVNAALDTEHAEVLVVSWSHLTLAALAAIAAAPKAVGVIVVESTDDARGQILSRAAFAGVPKPGNPRSAIVVGGGFGLGAPVPDFSVIPADSSLWRTRAALSTGFDLLGLLAHSDGVDLRLTREAVLCPFVDKVPQAVRPPACILSGSCRRVHKLVGEARGEPRLLDPGTIRCGTLVLLSCFGAMGVDSHVSPESTLLARVLANTRIGAVIASYGIVFTNGESTVDLMRACRGVSLGDAVNYFRRSAWFSESLFRPVLFGDPRAGWCNAARSLVSSSSCSGPDVAVPNVNDRRTQSYFLAELINSAEKIRGNQAGATAAREYLEQCVADTSHESTRRAQLAVIEMIAPLGSAPVHLWASVVRFSRVPNDDCSRCPQCRNHTESFGASSVTTMNRWLVTCPRCGIILDTDRLPSVSAAQELLSLAAGGAQENGDVLIAWVEERNDGQKAWGIVGDGGPPRGPAQLAVGYLIFRGLNLHALRLVA